MRLRTAATISAAAWTALAAACSDGATLADPVAPEPTTAAAPGTPAGAPSDTTRPSVYPPAVRVQGRVLRSAAGGAFAPVANARVTLYRNVLVDGRGVSQKVAERTTGADGAYLFEGAPGGPYVLALNVTPDRFYGEALAYAMGNVAEITADLKVWTATAVPVDSTTR